MERRTLILIAIAIGAIVIGMFEFAYYSRQAIVPQEEVPVVASSTPYDYITRVDAKHFYIDGTHTIAGEIPMPTACDLLESDAIVRESSPEQVTINFTVINNAENCAQMIVNQRFMVSFDASSEAAINARFMGRDIELNLVPAAEGETPEDFELYIKG